MQWIGAAVVFALLITHHRPWSDLGLAVPSDWRLIVSVALVAGLGWIMIRQARAVAASPRLQERIRNDAAPLSAVLPHTLEEYRWFQAVSITAGFCEELLFRGFLVWVLQPWLGLWFAAAASATVFGLAHGYQGVRHGLKATATGAVLGALALLLHSIVPGMLLHAIVDLGSGAAVYPAFREREPATNPS